ncbi:hypothetical protein JTB14_003804 [Gonioctena quinquepunctata]|nr:hypothetical protein JTB14_003804 [Gonioctena quinquepunctata]
MEKNGSRQDIQEQAIPQSREKTPENETTEEIDTSLQHHFLYYLRDRNRIQVPDRYGNLILVSRRMNQVHSERFGATEADCRVFVKEYNRNVIMAIYVDDGLIAASNKNVNAILESLRRKIEIKYGDLKFYSGSEIMRNPDGSIFMNPSKYSGFFFEKSLKQYQHLGFLHLVMMRVEEQLKYLSERR